MTEKECAYQDGYDAGYSDGRIGALVQIRDTALEIMQLYEDLNKEYEYAKKEEAKKHEQNNKGIEQDHIIT